MKAYQYRIYPNLEQKELINKHFGCARHVYNWGLGLKRDIYESEGKSLSKRDIQDQLVLSKKEDKPWLKEVNSQSLLASLGHLDIAFTNFFKGRAKFPRFKKKSSGWQSYQCPQHVTVDFDKNILNLPKLKGIKVKLHRPFEGQIKTVTIKKTPTGKYFASLLIDDQSVKPLSAVIEEDKTLGIDLGLTHFFIDSEENKIDNPRFQKESLDKLGQEQKIFARKKQGSGHYAKQKQRVACIHEKIANQRKDFLHKESTKLIGQNFTSYAVEDLHIKGMVKNKKLSRSISDAGWGMFITLLNYKAEWNGKNILPIGRFVPSSKTCHHCHSKIEKLPLSIRKWQCPSCQNINDRDINAAKNIRDFALETALGNSVSVKRSRITTVIAKGIDLFDQYGSEEAPPIAMA